MRIQELVRTGARIITLSALTGARELGFDEEDIDEVVIGLTESDFYKTMPAEKLPGLWQDVYRPKHKGQELYVKLQIVGKAVVISFKRR